MRVFLTILFITFCLQLFGQINSYDKIKTIYNQGKYKESAKLCSKTLKNINYIDTLYKKVLIYRVASYMSLLDYKSAILDWKQLIVIDSTDLTSYIGIAFAYGEIGDRKSCLEYSIKAYEIDHNDPLVCSNIAYNYNEINKFEESLKYSNIGLEQKNLQNNVKALLLNNRGYSYIGLKQYDRAIIDINQSIELKPNNSFAYYYRALANIGLREMATVCQDLERSKSLGGKEMTEDLISKYCKNK